MSWIDSTNWPTRVNVLAPRPLAYSNLAPMVLHETWKGKAELDAAIEARERGVPYLGFTGYEPRGWVTYQTYPPWGAGSMPANAAWNGPESFVVPNYTSPGFAPGYATAGDPAAIAHSKCDVPAAFMQAAGVGCVGTGCGRTSTGCARGVGCGRTSMGHCVGCGRPSAAGVGVGCCGVGLGATAIERGVGCCAVGATAIERGVGDPAALAFDGDAGDVSAFPDLSHEDTLEGSADLDALIDAVLDATPGQYMPAARRVLETYASADWSGATKDGMSVLVAASRLLAIAADGFVDVAPDEAQALISKFPLDLMARHNGDGSSRLAYVYRSPSGWRRLLTILRGQG